ncbi:hypothetical protein evm_015316, partial [Chilo suppressalis]
MQNFDVDDTIHEQLSSKFEELGSQFAKHSPNRTLHAEEAAKSYLVWADTNLCGSERDVELTKEAQRQEENDKLRKEFAKHANAFHQWLTETRTSMMEGTGSLEQQLATLRARAGEVRARRADLRRLEEL